MRRLMLALAFLVLLAGGCDPEPSGSDRPVLHPNPGAVHGNGGHGDPNVNQPAPVQGDPEAHNTQPGYVVMFVTWKSENKLIPAITAAVNGSPIPLGDISAPTLEGDRAWHGDWEWEGPGKVGDTYTVTAKGKGTLSLACEIGWKGQFHSDIQRYGCAQTYTLQ